MTVHSQGKWDQGPPADAPAAAPAAAQPLTPGPVNPNEQLGGRTSDVLGNVNHS